MRVLASCGSQSLTTHQSHHGAGEVVFQTHTLNCGYGHWSEAAWSLLHVLMGIAWFGCNESSRRHSTSDDASRSPQKQRQSTTSS